MKHGRRIIPSDNIKFLENVCIANLSFSSFFRSMLRESTIQGTNTCWMQSRELLNNLSKV